MSKWVLKVCRELFCTRHPSNNTAYQRWDSADKDCMFINPGTLNVLAGQGWKQRILSLHCLMCRDCWTNPRQSMVGNSAQYYQVLIMPGESHNECALKIWGRSSGTGCPETYKVKRIDKRTYGQGNSYVYHQLPYSGDRCDTFISKEATTVRCYKDKGDRNIKSGTILEISTTANCNMQPYNHCGAICMYFAVYNFWY